MTPLLPLLLLSTTAVTSAIDISSLIVPTDKQIKQFRKLFITDKPLNFSFRPRSGSISSPAKNFNMGSNIGGTKAQSAAALQSEIDSIEVKAEYYKGLLNNVKKNLKNSVTAKLSSSTWHLHTSSHHITKKLGKNLRLRYNTEITTQAWCKFYEVLNCFSQHLNIESSRDNFRVMHLCEAPGAFVTCMNHFLKTKFRLAAPLT